MEYLYIFLFTFSLSFCPASNLGQTEGRLNLLGAYSTGACPLLFSLKTGALNQADEEDTEMSLAADLSKIGIAQVDERWEAETLLSSSFVERSSLTGFLFLEKSSLFRFVQLASKSFGGQGKGKSQEKHWMSRKEWSMKGESKVRKKTKYVSVCQMISVD